VKRSITLNFLHRIRIRGGEFDASARAMHRKAAVENVSVATIERTLMSTKTTFKRVALVAVAAMGFGLLTGVAANAAPSVVISPTYAGAGTAAGTQVPGGQSSFTYTTTDTTTTVALTGVGSVVSATGGTTVPASITPGTNTFSIAAYAGNTLLITSTVAGVSTLTLTPIGDGGVPGTPVTATVTWSAVVVPTLNHSTAFIVAPVITSPATVDSTPLSVAAAVTGTAYGRVTVTQYSSADSATVLTTANTTAVVASISGAGSVSTRSDGTLTGASATVAAGGSTNGVSDFYVYPNGVAGIGTLTISVNGTVVSTKLITFAGIAASFSIGTPSNTVIGVGKTGTVVITALDANGNAAVLPALTVTSATPAVATVTSVVGGTITLTGVAVGTSVITVANSATLPTITATFTVTVGRATAKTVTMAFDKASYAPGEAMVLTVTAKGSDGAAVGDGALAVFGTAGVTSNVALQGTLPGASVTFAGGVATFALFAPLASGTINLAAVEGAGTDNVIAGGTAAAITASADVAGDTSAVDAANAATDAANYAADAADAATTAAEEATAAAVAAQDSADAATAAVVALGLRVAVLYAATRTQVLRLQALLVRLIKKLHA